MEELLDTSTAGRRFNTILLGIFAALALSLALVGVYGLISYSTEQRTREFGIRIALGARPRDMVNLVLGQGLRLIAAGALVGVVGAVLMAQFLEKSNLLFDVSARDPLTYAAITILLATTGLAACYVPARRAMRVEPTVALRSE